MRQLSSEFLRQLQSGFLSEITKYVIKDHDLDLEIRKNYVNVYYKGNSLLELKEGRSPSIYKAKIHPKFLRGVRLSLEFSKDVVPQFIESIPLIKQNVNWYGAKSLETEYEQLFIRANNLEGRNNTEYVMIDRQYAVERKNRLDVVGMFWDRNNRQHNHQAPLCLIEVKYAGNGDINDVSEQLARYYDAISKKADFSREMEGVFKQKLDLGLYEYKPNQIKALRKLSFTRDISTFQFIIILVDYNPHSSLLDMQKIQSLPFARQIKIFHAGFGMWSHNAKPVLG